jgi:hypothetical protein
MELFVSINTKSFHSPSELAVILVLFTAHRATIASLTDQRTKQNMNYKDEKRLCRDIAESFSGISNTYIDTVTARKEVHQK